MRTCCFLSPFYKDLSQERIQLSKWVYDCITGITDEHMKHCVPSVHHSDISRERGYLEQSPMTPDIWDYTTRAGRWMKIYRMVTSRGVSIGEVTVR